MSPARHAALGLVMFPFFGLGGTMRAEKGEEGGARFVVELPLPDEAALPQTEPFTILRQHISKEPLGPLVRSGDDPWLELARWSLMAMIEAEELGVSRANVEAMRASDKPQIQRFLGVLPGAGRGLGLDDAWAYRIIAQVGNYGDSFEANLGAGSALKLDRGVLHIEMKLTPEGPRVIEVNARPTLPDRVVGAEDELADTGLGDVTGRAGVGEGGEEADVAHRLHAGPEDIVFLHLRHVVAAQEQEVDLKFWVLALKFERDR